MPFVSTVLHMPGQSLHQFADAALYRLLLPVSVPVKEQISIGSTTIIVA